MNEFIELEGRDPKGAERVTELVSHLLRHQFIHIDDRGSPGRLETLHRTPLRKMAEAWFDVAGYRLVFNEAEGWAGILPEADRIRIPQMRVDETIVLLLLRRLWEEKIQTGMIVGRGSVLLTFNEAFVAYGELVGRGRRQSLALGAFRDILVAFSRKALVELGPFDDEQQNQELTIRPIVAVVAGDAFVASLEALIAKVELNEPDPADGEGDDDADAEEEAA
ncbi:DUF4194 domain-containing protein [Brevundimonas sp.]|uniref:DUF4194 domain-containing protein n=1 Tax=Brevundimonas sp. TaxID=1871086 RepID=UPI003D6D85B9